MKRPSFLDRMSPKTVNLLLCAHLQDHFRLSPAAAESLAAVLLRFAQLLDQSGCGDGQSGLSASKRPLQDRLFGGFCAWIRAGSVAQIGRLDGPRGLAESKRPLPERTRLRRSLFEKAPRYTPPLTEGNGQGAMAGQCSVSTETTGAAAPACPVPAHREPVEQAGGSRFIADGVGRSRPSKSARPVRHVASALRRRTTVPYAEAALGPWGTQSAP